MYTEAYIFFVAVLTHLTAVTPQLSVNFKSTILKTRVLLITIFMELVYSFVSVNWIKLNQTFLSPNIGLLTINYQNSFKLR